MITKERYADLADHVGEELGTSDWLSVEQELIDRFADLTGDHMWVHTDSERAARELEGGRTIAHGLLTFSLIPQLSYQVVNIPDPGRTFSYGTNRLRYVAPVSAGDRIRLHVTLLDADRQHDRTFLTFKYVMEIEGKDKPALVSEQVLLTH